MSGESMDYICYRVEKAASMCEDVEVAELLRDAAKFLQDEERWMSSQAERYMKLPVDADGVPIQVGDFLECHANGYDGKFEVFAVGDGVVIGNHDIEFVTNNPTDCRHVIKRTVEDVLRDVWEEALDYSKSDMWRNPEEMFAERAAEIRKLMGSEH